MKLLIWIFLFIPFFSIVKSQNTTMDQRLTIITLGVENVKVSTDFYENTMGWIKMESSNENITFFKLNGIMLSLFQKDSLAEDAEVQAEGTGFKSFSIAYNANSKDEVNAVFKDLTDKRVKIIKQPKEVFWGGYSGYFADPDGFLWEVAYNPYLEMDAKGNVKE
jgi:uncharacterized glyoxalase superfamily protein PhnB